MQDTEGSIELGVDTIKIVGDATKLFEELAKAQGEFPDVPRTAIGQIGKDRKFKYADYATIIKTVRPSLSKYGIALIQPLHSRGDVAVSTIILAGHGASIWASFAFEPDSNPQEFGRQHTYYRRYQLQGTMGLEGDDDADSSPKEKKETNGYTEKPPVQEQKSAPAVEQKTVAPTRLKTSYTLKELNNLLEAGMKQAGMKMADVREFYKEHVDKAGFEKPDSMSLEQKATLLDKMVKLKGVTPF